MTDFKPEHFDWVCSTCKMFYQIPRDTKELVGSPCCVAALYEDESIQRQRESEDNAEDAWWRNNKED